MTHAIDNPAHVARERPKSRWSWRIGSLAGIDVFVHGTFVLLLGWIAISHLTHGQGVLAALNGVGVILALFGIVVLHELGHALMARRFGIGTRDITLLPIGGVARLERMPEDPKQELLVAIAGPAVNVVLAGLFFGLLLVLRMTPSTEAVHLEGGSFLAKLMWMNVSLAVFNLLPAFPMDGGRVLRALLAMRMTHMRATDLAARVGQAMAVVLGIAGFFVNPMLVLVAVFVWMGAQSEAVMEHVRTSIAGISVGDAMIQRFRTLTPDETVAHAVEHVRSEFQEDFPVIERGAVVGLLSRKDLISAMARGETSTPIVEVMSKELALAAPSMPLVDAMQLMGDVSGHAIVVMSAGQLVGMVTPARIGEILTLRQASQRKA